MTLKNSAHRVRRLFDTTDHTCWHKEIGNPFHKLVFFPRTGRWWYKGKEYSGGADALEMFLNELTLALALANDKPMTEPAAEVKKDSPWKPMSARPKKEYDNYIILVKISDPDHEAERIKSYEIHAENWNGHIYPISLEGRVNSGHRILLRDCIAWKETDNLTTEQVIALVRAMSTCMVRRVK